MSDAIAGGSVDTLCGAVAAAIWSRAPRWLETTRLDDDIANVGEPPCTLMALLDAAADIAAAAGFVVPPSIPRASATPDPAPSRAQRPQVVVEDVDDDDDDEDDGARPYVRGTRSNPHSVGSATSSVVERALATIARREATSISSHRLREDADDDDVVSAGQQAALEELPRARWPKRHADAHLVRRGWLAVATALISLRTRGATAWLADLRAAFSVRAVVVGLAEAQTLLLFAAAPERATGHALAAVLELSLLAIPPLVRAVPLLAAARLLLPSAEELAAKTVFPPTLSGFEVRRSVEVRAGPTDAPRTCKECKQSYTGAWPVHWASTCPARKPAAPAPPAPSGAKKGF
jgi:hypothetical protein